MIISIAEARKLMGKTSSKYSDGQIEEVINIFEFMADMAIDCYLIKRKKKNGGEKENDNQLSS